MFNIKYVKFFVVLSLSVVIALPLYVGFYLTPAFEKFILINTEKEAIRAATHLVSMYFFESDAAIQDGSGFVLVQDDSWLRRDFHLKKLKLFKPSGKVVYSTDHADIGLMKSNSYFTGKVAQGEIVSKIIRKKDASLEGQYLKVDVVEKYVPIMKEGIS